MICSNLDTLFILEKQENPNWKTALDWLKAQKWKDIPKGKTEIDGDRVYVLNQKYKSKPIEDCRYEAHQKYADIQISLSGVELIEVCRKDTLQTSVPYSTEEDIEFFEGSPDLVHRIVLSHPIALVLFPEDAHKPCIALGNPQDVEKIVLKVAIMDPL